MLRKFYFFIVECGIARFLCACACYACIRRSGTILIPYAILVSNFVSAAPSIAELAHGEKSRTHSITQLI